MKKIIAILLSVLCVLSFVACDSENNSSNENDENANTPCQHTYGEWQTDVSATCTTSGLQHRICSKCSDVETQTITALGHTTSDGVCSRCYVQIGNNNNNNNDNNNDNNSDSTNNSNDQSNDSTATVLFDFVQLSDGNYGVKGIKDTKTKNVVIPSTHNGKPVVSIEGSAFSGNERMLTISIPDSITYIGEWAFYNCKGLTTIELPNSVVDIDAYAFSGCSSLESLTLPNHLDYIASSAFYDCGKLTTVKTPLKAIATLPNDCIKNITVTGSGKIESETFSMWKTITSVIIEEGITEVGEKAFQYCDMIESISLPSSLTKIDRYAFMWCKSLKTINLPETLTVIGEGAFSYCQAMESITIPNSVSTLGTSLFNECKSLKNVTLPNNLTTLPEKTFWYCEALTYISIPNSVTVIGDYAFSHCKKMESISIPTGATKIGSNAFSYCEVLNELIIPEGVTELGTWVASNCTNLKKIVIPSTIVTFGDYLVNNCANIEFVECPVQCINNMKLDIRDSVVTLVFNAGTSIDGDAKQAVYGMKKLQNVVLCKSITTIDAYAFQNCTTLRHIFSEANSRPSGWNSKAFYGCNNASFHFANSWHYVNGMPVVK